MAEHQVEVEIAVDVAEHSRPHVVVVARERAGRCAAEDAVAVVELEEAPLGVAARVAVADPPS